MFPQRELQLKIFRFLIIDSYPFISKHVETCALLYNKEYYEKEVKGKVKVEVVTEV
jgi:hypothetical protein